MKTNNIKHTIETLDSEGNQLIIKIRLNDECKNGHQDFSIGGDIYQKGKPRTDRYFLSGGCIHEEILQARPDLKIFVDLHLCDYLGIPTHPVANGFYHLTNGFNKTPITSDKFRAKYCDYYRISGNQFDVLKQSKNKIQYYNNLIKLNILEQWKKQADKAIELLEQMSGQEFLIDSKRSQLIPPTEEELKEEQERQANGYYTPEAAQKREQEKQNKILAELAADRDKLIEAANIEFKAKEQVLLIGGSKALKNCIYYNHSKTLGFNWRGYDNISEEEYSHIVENIAPPEGVKIENKKA